MHPEVDDRIVADAAHGHKVGDEEHVAVVQRVELEAQVVRVVVDVLELA